jgi:polysaccharide export outer membrane protein
LQQVAYQSPSNGTSGTGGTPFGPMVQQPAGSGVTSGTTANPMVHPPAVMPMTSGPGCGPNGCGAGGPIDGAGQGIPVELNMTSHMPYIIEPPDILLLSPIRIVPKPPYTVGPFDVLLIRAAKALPDQPIEGTYTIDPSGAINLGYGYGYLRVGGLTLEDVERNIRYTLRKAGVTDPQIAVGLAQFRGVQQVQGQHLVRQDGTIALGNYGCVYIAGLTLAQAKVAIERHLANYLQDPEVGVDVGVYNSKYYYVITDGAGYGQSVFKFPVTGKETVLDGLNQIGGVPAVGAKKKIWLARPSPATHGCSQILPVDWTAITQAGVTATNYQLFPGDRIYVDSNCLIRTDNYIAQLISPVQRLLGVTLLGATTYQTLRNTNGNGNGGGVGFIAPLR